MVLADGCGALAATEVDYLLALRRERSDSLLVLELTGPDCSQVSPEAPSVGSGTFGASSTVSRTSQCADAAAEAVLRRALRPA
jgi:hypothetical protein